MRGIPQRFFPKWLGLAALLLAAAAQADVYRWQDAKGRVHYGDRPVAGAEHVAATPALLLRQVKHVHDGDTVVLDDGTRVRLLGINTPEIDSSTSTAESGGADATAWLKSRIEGRKVRLETDAELKDHYGRTLAHLFAEDGEHLNLNLVRQGLASASIFPPNLKHADAIAAAQEEAAKAKRGIWGDPAYAPRPIAELPSLRLRGWQRWQGRPTLVDYTSSFARLVFSEQVEVRIPKENLALFPSLQGWIGKSLEVRGWASRRKDQYSILVRHPSAVAVLE